MRLGILGGTFDPVHYGHLLLAETCRQELELDSVRIIPAGSPPHKQQFRITDGHARADMLELAVAGYPELIVDRRELRRQGASYTVETLTELQHEFPGAKLFFLMGADSLKDISSWREPDRIAQLATLVACNRPGHALPDGLEVAEWVGAKIAERTVLVRIPGVDLSATDLRDRVRCGKNLRFMTPRAVEAYVQQHRLYE